MKKVMTLTVMILVAGLIMSGCGSANRPLNAYTEGSDLLSDMYKKRRGVSSFRIAGRVDHLGAKQRVSGKLFIFAKIPKQLRVDLLSPFGSTLSVLTVKDGHFSMSDQREGIFMEGEAKPCNIARFIRIPLPVDDLIKILIGATPVIEGDAVISWNKEGFYRVNVSDGVQTQILDIDPDEDILALRRYILRDQAGVIYDIKFDRWRFVDGVHLPYEIRVKMPRDKADMKILYDDDGVEVNVNLPDDAWAVSFPKNADVKQVTCE